MTPDEIVAKMRDAHERRQKLSRQKISLGNYEEIMAGCWKLVDDLIRSVHALAKQLAEQGSQSAGAVSSESTERKDG